MKCGTNTRGHELYPVLVNVGPSQFLLDASEALKPATEIWLCEIA